MAVEVTNQPQPLMTPAQQEQFEALLRQIVEHEFGELTIVVVKGQVRFFRPQLSIQACWDEDTNL